MTQLGPGLGSTDHLTSSNVESMEYGFVVYDNPNHVTVSSSTSVYRRPRSKFCIGLITFGIVIVITSVALGFIIHYAVNSDRQVSPSSSTSNVQSHDYKATKEIKQVDFEGRIRITSLKWMPDLGNHAKELYRVVTNHIQKELNHVFEIGPLVERYNRTVVVDLSPGSVIVDFIVVLNSRRGIESDTIKAMMLQGLEKRSKFIKKLKSNHMPASKIVFDKRSLKIADSHNPDIKSETKYIPKPKILTEIRQPTTTSQVPHSTTFTNVSSMTKKSKNKGKKKKKKPPTTTTIIPSTTKLQHEITLPSTNKTESSTTANQLTTTTLSITTKPSTRKQKNTDTKTTVTTTPSKTLPNTEPTTVSTTPTIISNKSPKPTTTTKTKVDNTKEQQKPKNLTKKSSPSKSINGSLQINHHHYDYNDSRGLTHHHIHQGIQNASHQHNSRNSSSIVHLNNHYHSLDHPKHNHTQNGSHIEAHEQNHEHSHDQTFYHHHQNKTHNLSHMEDQKGFHNFSDHDGHNHSTNNTQHFLHKEVDSHHHRPGSNSSHSEVHHEIKHKDGSGRPEHGNVSFHHINNQSVFWSTNENDPKSFHNKSYDGHLTAIDDPPDRITDMNDTDAEEVPFLNSFSATDFAADGRETATLPNTIKEHVPQLTDLEQSDNHIPPHEPYSQNSRDKLENSIRDSRDRSKAMEYDRILAGMNRNTARSQHHESNMVDPEELAKESPPVDERFDNYWPHGNMNRPFNFPNRISTPNPVLPRTTKEIKESASASTKTSVDDLETGSGELTETFEDHITPPPTTTSKVIPHIRDIKRPSFDTSGDHHYFDSTQSGNPFPNSILPNENHGDTEDTPALVPNSEKIDFSRHHREEVQEEHIEHGEMEEPLFNLHHLEYASTRQPGKDYFDHPSHFHDQPHDLIENDLNITSSEEDIIPDLLANHLGQRQLNEDFESMLLHKNKTDILVHPLPISAAAGADFPMNTKGDIPASEQYHKKNGQSKKGQGIRETRDRKDDSVPDFIGHPVGGMAHLGPSNFMPFPPAAGTASGKEDLNEENALDMDYDSNLGPSNFMPLPPQSSLPKDHKAILPHGVTPPKVHVPKDGEGVLTPPPLIHKPGIITHVLNKNKKKVNKDKEEHAHSKAHVSFYPKNKSTRRSNNELDSSKEKTRLNLEGDKSHKESDGTKLESQNKTKGHSMDSRENSVESNGANRIDSKQLAPVTTPSDIVALLNSTSHYTRANLLDDMEPNATNDFGNLTETNEEYTHEIQNTNKTLIQRPWQTELNKTLSNGVNETQSTIGKHNDSLVVIRGA
ncbi:hypothetical protein LOTGIDRAFT_163537 [Lottia gigantea]|uniref:SEA domain-containing protein n=1 Tax=Lottia gigantea TaxID=225164 RepID=V4A7M2_LOTGI|nr:hypothetical protein LOTGIDRAFT_163537 [Lottia gigantea]ESO91020.1 hypothetical protein LOTGIDRAFT_163537 [Lottia gigantea]